MTRASRIDIPGLTYHVISRGVKRLPFVHEDTDRQMLLRYLINTREVLPFVLQQYCLMDNHYHFLIKTIVHPLSAIMHRFKSAFAKFINRKYEHAGHVFQGRFHSIPVETETYLKTVSRYIHLNPVKAGLVLRPEDYAWSNYKSLIDGANDPLADGRELLDLFGEDPVLSRSQYQEFVNDGIGKPEQVTEEKLFGMRMWGNPLQAMRTEKRQRTLALRALARRGLCE